MELYFAYGSNMNEPDFKKWCEKNKVNFEHLYMKRLAVVILRNYELCFNCYSKTRKGGVASIEASNGSSVYGLLFEIDEKTKMILRKKEACYNTPQRKNFYDEILISIEVEKPLENGRSPNNTILVNNERLSNVLTYQVSSAKKQKQHVKPSEDYFNLILNSAKDFNFPEFYVNKLLKTLETH